MAKEQTKEDFSDEYIPQSNWMAFDTVGENIKGTLVDKFHKPGDGEMPAQTVYVLKNVEAKCSRLDMDGPAEDIQDEVKVGIKVDNDFINSRMKKAKFGQRVGFYFAEEIPAKRKGYNPAKSVKPYIWGEDPKYSELKEENEAFEEEQNNEIKVDDIPY